MAATATGSSRRAPSGSVLRSLSPSSRYNRFCRSPSSSSSSTAFAYSSSGFTSGSSTFFTRSASPTRVNMYGPSSASSSSSVRLNAISPNRSISTVNPPRNHQHHQIVKKQTGTTKRTCMCSPTTHPGSFRCSLHKGLGNSSSVNYSSNNRLNARRSAMTNSLVRIGGVEGDLVKRALSALIRPSSHQQRRRAAFQPRPSRLSVMCRAQD